MKATIGGLTRWGQPQKHQLSMEAVIVDDLTMVMNFLIFGVSTPLFAMLFGSPNLRPLFAT
jgi:hypothetical protein